MSIVTISADGRVYVHENPDTSLRFLQSVVAQGSPNARGLIEYVPLVIPNPDSAAVYFLDLWVNEEGLLMRLPQNLRASMLTNQYLVGDVAITQTNEDGDTIPIAEDALKALMWELVNQLETIDITTK